MSTKTIATALLAAGMMFGSLTAAHATGGCSYGTHTEAKSEAPASS